MVSPDGGRRLLTEPKTEAGRRVVALSHLVLDSLAEHLNGIGEDPDSLLLPPEGGGLLPATTFYKHWRRARHQVEHDELHLQRRAPRTREDQIVAGLCPFKVLADLVNLQSPSCAPHRLDVGISNRNWCQKKVAYATGLTATGVQGSILTTQTRCGLEHA